MEKKFILTEKELFNLISNAYADGFQYSKDFDEEHKTGSNWDSKGRDVLTYTEDKIKELEQ